MIGASIHDLKEGRDLRRLLARESAAYLRWVREAERLGLHGPAALRRLGRCPPQWVMPGGEVDGRVWLPRYVPRSRWADTNGFVPPDSVVPFSGALRPYQRAAIDEWRMNAGSGVIVAPCGSGKTVIGCAVIGSVPSPALVLVTQVEIQRQWCERLKALLGVEAGVIRAGKWEEDRRVVVATVQSLAKVDSAALEEFGKRFGLVVYDEAHHVPAQTSSWVLAHLPGRYRLGLTATPDRADGLGEWLTWDCGPVVKRIAEAELQACGAVVVPRIRRIDTGWTWDGVETPWARMMSELVGNGRRNHVVTDELRSQVARGRVTLALTGRVEHAMFLAEACGGRVLVGASGSKARREALEAVRSRRCLLLVATQLADEGLDLPELDTVALCYPDRDAGRTQQRIGRALRPSPGKTAEVLDFVDSWGPLRGWAQKRERLYREKGWV